MLWHPGATHDLPGISFLKSQLPFEASPCSSGAVTAHPEQPGALPSKYTQGMAFSIDLIDYATLAITFPTVAGQVCCLCMAAASHLSNAQVMLTTF